MKKISQFQKGLILVVIGLSLIFPFISKIVLKNIAVIAGFYLILTGMKLLLFNKKKCDPPKEKTFEYQEYNDRE